MNEFGNTDWRFYVWAAYGIVSISLGIYGLWIFNGNRTVTRELKREENNSETEE